MINPGVSYRVTGRYMDGTNIIGYHLVGDDDSQSQESKERVIYLIGKGKISNMRVQIGTNNEVILRGKGVNLNNLPVYDVVKNKFRNDTHSQEVANSGVKSNDIQLGQYKIVKRIMQKNKCLGYQLQDNTGALTKKGRSQVIKLATERLISNAIVQKYQKDANSAPELILRGVECDLAKLPILIVDDNGNIIDPSACKGLTVRAVYVKRSGIIYDTTNNNKIPFKVNDFIIFNATGHIEILDAQSVKSKYKQENNAKDAACDSCLPFVSKYYIEFFGDKPRQLSANTIKKWVILKAS